MTTVTSTRATVPLLSRLPRWRKADPVLILSAVWCALVVLVAVAAPLLAPYDPSQTDILAANQEAPGSTGSARTPWGATSSPACCTARG